MAKAITLEFKEKAETLRSQGLTYKAIAEQLDVSENWCKVNLRLVVKHNDKLIENLCEKSKSTKGVSKGEIAKAFDIYSMHKQDGVKVLNSQVKKIRSKDKKNIVRPDWMVPDVARFMTDEIVETSLVIDDRCNESAYALYCDLKEAGFKDQDLPSVSKIKHAMFGIAAGMSSTSPGSTERLANWLESLYKTANELSVRNTKTKVSIAKQPEIFDFSDIEEFIY